MGVHLLGTALLSCSCVYIGQRRSGLVLLTVISRPSIYYLFPLESFSRPCADLPSMLFFLALMDAFPLCSTTREHLKYL